MPGQLPIAGNLNDAAKHDRTQQQTHVLQRDNASHTDPCQLRSLHNLRNRGHDHSGDNRGKQPNTIMNKGMPAPVT